MILNIYKILKRRILNYIINKLSNVLRIKKKIIHYEYLINKYVNYGLINYLNFNFNDLKFKTLSYLSKMKVGKEIAIYKYSNSTKKPNIYSSAYVVMVLSLYNELDKYSSNDKTQWLNYFNSFQDKESGLFYDESIFNDMYNNCDWWGARHLALNILPAYKALGGKPKFKFNFLKKYYEKNVLINWLENLDFENQLNNDSDNQLMNIGCLLQYNRDYFDDYEAGESIKILQKWLMNKINVKTGLWGNFIPDTPEKISRAVQYYYHLYLIFMYDGIQLPYKEYIIDWVLKTQNIIGGFGVNINSSACEDIDSADILLRFSRFSKYQKDTIFNSLQKAFIWILSNQNDDGGYVFKRNEKFVYGHKEMSSEANESSMFATWFRTLNIAYLCRYFNFKNEFKINTTPGYEF